MLLANILLVFHKIHFKYPNNSFYVVESRVFINIIPSVSFIFYLNYTVSISIFIFSFLVSALFAAFILFLPDFLLQGFSLPLLFSQGFGESLLLFLLRKSSFRFLDIDSYKLNFLPLSASYPLDWNPFVCEV